MSKKVIELIRVSTEGQAAGDRGGIPSQRAANLRTAAQYDLQIVRTIELANISGAAVLRAPEIQELLRLVESPDIEGVVTREFSRLMRPENFSDYALLQVFADTGTILYLPEGPIDLGSKSGRLLGTIRAAIAGLERTEILERVWAAKEEKRRAGKHAQSSIALPYGVGYDAARGWFYKPEAEKVREAFRLFSAGQTSYTTLGKHLGIEPFNLRIIMRNRIYTGWRVYDRRRDPAAHARRTTADGRQADRPKILRSPDDIIRVRVMDPLVSESEFEHVQKMMDLKKQNHWRCEPDHLRRFAFNGLLRCGGCGNLLYTHARAPNDWYVCKSRTSPDRKIRENRGLYPCKNPYMQRLRLEKCINKLIADGFSDHRFLTRVASEYLSSHASEPAQATLTRMRGQIEALRAKRKRILDVYLEGVINRDERDRRLADLKRDENLQTEMLLKAEVPTPTLSSKILAEMLAPLAEWEFLNREQRRCVLRAVMPEIHVFNYQVKGLSLIAPTGGDQVSRTGTDSLPPPA
jgi:DNA invertase Pin-like site-specific DNA recombinase